VKKLLLALLLSVCAVALSQNVVISGKTNRPGSLVRVFVYDDLLVRGSSKRAETHADSEGRFSLSFPLKGIAEAVIAVDLERVDMILREKSSYNIEIVIPDDDKTISYFDRTKPELRIMSADDGNLQENAHIADNIINAFALDNFSRMVRQKRYDLLDTLDAYIDEALGEYDSEWLANQIRYRKASLVQVVYADGGKRIIRDYYQDNDVLYDCPAYFDLFAEVFKNYFHSRQFNITYLRMAYYDSFDSFVSYLKTDKTISSDARLGELVIIWNLLQFYYELPADRELIMGYFAEMKSKTAFAEHKIIIDDVVRQVTRLAPDTPAPDFALANVNGEKVTLADYKDYVVVLQFVGDLSPLMMNDFYSLREMAGLWGSKVKVLTIVPHEAKDDYVRMFRKEGMTWDILDRDDNILILEDYEVPTFPAYVVVKKDGNIGIATAPSPDQGLDKHVARFLK